MAAWMKERAAATAQKVLIPSKLTTTFDILVNRNWGGRVHFTVSKVCSFSERSKIEPGCQRS